MSKYYFGYNDKFTFVSRYYKTNEYNDIMTNEGII